MDCQEIDKEYQVLGLAGSGSTGLVYRAKHRLSGEDVAIKEYPGGETPFSRILQELSFLFSTRHPNLVTCLNLIYGGYRRSYLVMEYARNGSLRDFLNREKQVSSQEALAAVEQVLEGLAHLHAEGVIHCDLKPENVLLFPREEDSELVKLSDQILKITDFDVSVRAGKGDTTKSQGSPMYMAPEQFYDKVTPSSDLYSVGAILFELVTGHFLFEGDTSHLFSQHLNVEPDFDLIQDEKIREFCQALLKKDPYQRPEDAEAALVLLRCLVKDCTFLQKVGMVRAGLCEKPNQENSPPLAGSRGDTLFSPCLGRLLAGPSQRNRPAERLPIPTQPKPAPRTRSLGVLAATGRKCLRRLPQLGGPPFIRRSMDTAFPTSFENTSSGLLPPEQNTSPRRLQKR
ncbi:MAG TPA: serine/threonine protein kinase [Phycisphaerales bacterium]|nr:serine/threonine protein kinase [Phycisphaerales bacterium]